MQFSLTTATLKIAKLTKRLRFVQGGTGASKTISILIGLIEFAQKDKTPTVTSIVAESIPHLKKGALRDFENILKAHNVWKDNQWYETDKTYTFGNGSQIEFFGADQSEKLRGGRRDRLFINECNNVSFKAFEELEVRTREFGYFDWNPTGTFWFNDEVVGKRDDYEHIILNYLDNEALDKATVNSIEQRKGRRDWWMSYGLGQLSELEGKIYKNWQIISEIPHEAKLVRTGLDFGYSNDHTAIVDIYYLNGGYILDEVAYEKGLSNKQIADILKIKEKKAVTIADSAEPKSIDEIKSYNVTILPASKGPGSVSRDIAFVQDQSISITARSTGGIKEYRNCTWLIDKDGKILNEEDPRCINDFLAAARYGLASLKPQNTEVLQVQSRMWSRNESSQEMNSSR